MKNEKEKLILMLIRFLPIVFIIIISLLLTYFISIDHTNNLQTDREEIKEEFINNNKNMIKANIETIDNYIKKELSLSKNDLKQSIKSQVYIAHSIMTSIYNAYKDTKTKEEITELIKNALKNIRFNEGRGYFFIYELDGTNIFHAIKPKREGKSFFDAQDINGTYIVRESISIAKSKKMEGFQNWFFHKTDKTNKEYEKIGFIKKFEPYNWFLGTGEYVEDFKSMNRNKILDYISILKYIDDGYIFVIDYEGNVLVNKNKLLSDSEIFKTKRLETYEKFIKSTKKDKFAEYKVENTYKKNYIKISYLKKIPSLNFVIGTGFDLDTASLFIKKRIKNLEEEYDSNLKLLFNSAIIITIILLLISYFISKYFESLFNEYRNNLNNKNLILNKAQKQARIGSWEQTFDNDSLIWSDEVYRIFEIDLKDEFTFDSFLNIVHPEDRDNLTTSFKKSVDEHTEYYLEHRLLFPDNRIKYVIERAEHFYDENNNHKNTLGTVQDITKRKEAEISLQESEEQYKSLMQEAPYAIEIFDKNGLQIGVNKAHEKLWGIPTSKTLRQFNILTDEKFKNSGILPFIQKAYAGQIVQIPPHKFDPVLSTSFTNGLGKTRIIKSQIYPLKDANDNVENIIVTQIDVSSEEEAKRRDSILNSVFQVIPDILFVMKKDGKIIDYRAKEDKNLYLNPKVFLGKMMQETLPKDIGEVFDKNMKKLLEDEELKVFTYELNINNEIKHFEARMAKLPHEDEHIITIVRDITEKEKMKDDNLKQERLLYQQSKMAAMGEMLGNIAHQWRQPLSTISTAATGSKIQKEMDCLSDEQLIFALDAINSSAQYLSQTIEDFRSFFDPSNNKKSQFLVSNIIEKTLNLVSSQFTAKDIEIIKTIEDISVLSIENELIQVLVNVLNNSRDALLNLEKEKRYIFINAYKEEDSLIIEIKDNAKGVPKEIIDRIFEPYFTTKYKSQGTGIGLYMCEEIVRTHLDGTIVVKNETYEYKNNKYIGANFIIKINLNL